MAAIIAPIGEDEARVVPCPTMRIGVVSDTHNNLANVARIVELLNGADVERVVHTGDITQAKTLEVLARLKAPLQGVYGNNDLERDALESAAARFDIALSDPPLELSWAERRLLVVHDPRDFEHSLPAAQRSGNAPDLVLHGHDHRYRLEQRVETVVFNPGECAGHMKGRNAIGVVDLVRLECETLLF
jgi:putative phosphoesterase